MIHFTTFIVAASLALFAGATPSLAQSSNQIEEALKPKVDPNKPVTRSLGTRSISGNSGAAAPAVDAKTQAVISRSIGRVRAIGIVGTGAAPVEEATKEEREQIAEVVKDMPKIDLAIFFDYNSDVVGPKAIKAVTDLGVALRSDALKGATIMLNGHTDAAGSPEYNLSLSHRRAQSVRRYLIETFGIPEKQILVTGFGKERLKNLADPLSGENRRVEVVNMAQEVAGR